MSEKRQVLRAAGIVGFFTLLSRVTGLLRDGILAAVFGQSRMQDIFQIAFEMPNMVRRVMGEGALSAFIVPLLAERRQAGGEPALWQFFNRASNFVMLIALLIALFGMFFAREAFLLFGGGGLFIQDFLLRFGIEVQSSAPRLSPALIDQYLDIGSRMTRIMFPYVIGLTFAAMMMGACHSLKKFAAPSIGGIALNLAMILTGGAALALQTDDNSTAIMLCWAVLAGAVLRVAIMAPTLRAAGWTWQPILSFRDRELLRLMNMMGLAVLTMSISQINIMVSNQFAIFLGEGVKSSLVFSQRLIQFPMALTATAVATAMLPQLTHFLIEGRGRELRDMMAFTKRLEMVLINPAMVGLVFLGLPILQLLYEHGRWTADATRDAYVALVFYAPGLLPMGWMRLLIPLFYARKDMITPFKAALVGMIANVILNWIFAFHTDMRQGGLALANTLAMFVNYGALAWYLRGDLHAAGPGESPRIAETFWKTMAAALVACAAGWVLYNALARWLGPPAGIAAQAALLFPILALVAAAYFTLARLLHVPDSQRATDLFLKKLKIKS